MSSQHVEGEIRLWRDKYVTRIEREMYLAFPSLEKTLLELVQNNLKMLFLGRTEKFRSTIIQPAVREWYETVVRPILDDANQELQHVIDKYGIPEIDAVGMPSTRDVVIPVVTSTVGFVVLFGSVFLGIGSRSVLWVLTIPVLNKVLLIIGTLLGAILLALGVGQVVFMKERVAKT